MADFGTNAEDAPVLRFADVSRVHEAGASKVVSLEHADLTLHAGEFVAIMGPSGSGKSTLLNLAGGLDLPTEGRVFVDGVDLTKLDAAQRAMLRRRLIGYVFQDYNLLPSLSAVENVSFPLELDGWAPRKAHDAAMEALREAGVEELTDRRPEDMSGGQAQRVAIARALMQKAKIILADEPIASLDPESARIVMETLHDINQNDGITVVVTLHQVDYALRYCERIVALRQGHVFFDGASHQFDNERFDHLYRSVNRVEERAQAA